MTEPTRGKATEDRQTGSGTTRPDGDDADSTSPLQGEWEDDPHRDEEDVEREDGPLDPPPERDDEPSSTSDDSRRETR